MGCCATPCTPAPRTRCAARCTGGPRRRWPGSAPPAERVAEQLLAAPQAADDWTIGWLAEVAPTLVARAPLVAVELLDRAKAAAPHADPRREAIDTWLVAALYLLGRYEDAARLAAPLLAAARDPDVAGRAAWTLGSALSRMGRHQHARAVLAEALDRGGLSPAWTARRERMCFRPSHGPRLAQDGSAGPLVGGPAAHRRA